MTGRRTGGQVATAASLCGFAPLGAARATRLVLGTMPGQASLAAFEYYAHPRNAFWTIIDRLYDIPRSLPYAQRVSALEATGIAVWDVLAQCVRSTSLDSDIDQASAQPNDLGAFLHDHPAIRVIYFNGNPARRLFEKLVLPQLAPQATRIARLTLPSTSPTNARLSLEEKLQAWSVLAAQRQSRGPA